MTSHSLSEKGPVRRRIPPPAGPPRVAVVGPCAAGKSTLVAKLRRQGIDAHSVAQEHSNVPYMYLLREPDYVVYLEVSHAEICRRRSVSWGPARLRRQRDRLRRAREEADLIIRTDGLGTDQVSRRVRELIEERSRATRG